MLFLAPPLLWGFSPAYGESTFPGGLYINLNASPLYAKAGFESPADLPDLSSGVWTVVPPAPDLRRTGSLKALGLPEIQPRPFLSPLKEGDQEWTLVIPFTLSPEQFEGINNRRSGPPGIFFSILGVNWEIFLNGHPVRSEVHLDEQGQIRSGRNYRYNAVPLDPRAFVPGTNRLALRIIGPPNHDGTGMTYEQFYYIGEYESILKSHSETLIMALIAVYIFVGFYHFLFFFNQPQGRYNLYYGLFSIILGIYFLSRSHSIYSLIPNSEITFRIEYASVFLALPLLSSFLEHLTRGRITLFTRLYWIFCWTLVITQCFLPRSFGDDLLRIWWVSDFFEFAYILGYDMFYAFFLSVRESRKTPGTPLGKAVLNCFIRTPLGNLIIGILVMSITGTIDILSSLYAHRGVLFFSSYGFFIFTLTTSVILARRFGSLFQQLDEMNGRLEAVNVNLEATVQERTRELEHQTEVAKSASRAKSDFLARMSHEIRTPLNAILGLSEVELQDPPPGKTRVNLEKIYHSGSHLLEIVNDILDISKIESGNYEIFPADYEFCLLVSDTIQLNILRIGIKPIEFKLEVDEAIPQKLCGDELRIKQIFNNLLSNAFKYTEEGEVRLRIGWRKDSPGGRLEIAVEDTGRGIKPEDMKKLFSEYTQLGAASNRQIEGTGLGLCITRGLVELMGGSLSVESEFGRGSVFRVSLPQGVVDGTPIGAEQGKKLMEFRTGEELRRTRGSLIRSWMPYGKVLVVDDLPTNLDVMTGLLMPYGLQVDTALDGWEAVEAVKKEEPRYDLIFMDHMMPGMDGVEAARIIRNEIGGSYARDVPIVVLTANAIAGNREMFFRNGFTDFISKPIDIKQLDMVLNQWIRDKQSAQTLMQAEIQAPERKDPETGGAGGPEGVWLLEHPVEGIDFDKALALYANSGAVYMGILKSFAAHTPSLLKKMGEDLETSLSEYAIKVHGLKGACNAVCAGEAAALAWDLELAAREGNSPWVRTNHGELNRGVLALTGRLKAVVEEWEARRPEEKKEWRDAPAGELLSRLSAAALELDARRIEEALTGLEHYRYRQGEDLVRWLREQAEAFDYPSIRRRIVELTEERRF
ncbi:MAG: response regulator [Spirochaetales bacterium]|nr:response regulator [Spirochaetales bacterium]